MSLRDKYRTTLTCPNAAAFGPAPASPPSPSPAIPSTFLACFLFPFLGVHLVGILPAQEPAAGKILLALSSYRERPKHPNIFFYEHDGVGAGKIVGSVGTPRGVAS